MVASHRTLRWVAAFGTSVPVSVSLCWGESNVSTTLFTQTVFFQLERTPPDVNRRSHPPQSQGYDASLANHGPSSRPPPHPAIHSNPYDDPYYYYGALEMGAPQGPSVGGPMNALTGTGQPSMGGLRLDAGISGGIAKSLKYLTFLCVCFANFEKCLCL